MAVLKGPRAQSPTAGGGGGGVTVAMPAMCFGLRLETVTATAKATTSTTNPVLRRPMGTDCAPVAEPAGFDTGSLAERHDRCSLR